MLLASWSKGICRAVWRLNQNQPGFTMGFGLTEAHLPFPPRHFQGLLPLHVTTSCYLFVSVRLFPSRFFSMNGFIAVKLFGQLTRNSILTAPAVVVRRTANGVYYSLANWLVISIVLILHHCCVNRSHRITLRYH